MAVIENAKLNGAQLLKEMAKTGTGAVKLALPRQILAFVHRKENRIARADELIDVMEKAGVIDPYKDFPPTPHLTLQKARALAITGTWDGPVESVEVPVEELLLAGQKLPEEPKKPVTEEAVEPANPFDADRNCTLEEELSLKKVARPKQPAKKPAPVTA